VAKKKNKIRQTLTWSASAPKSDTMTEISKKEKIGKSFGLLMFYFFHKNK
tara:strand:- start:292 stop:441 length:150 start_codon:yes stop_codon:yes gene_type:complete